ncbi:MAG: NADPH:quinone reductase-like Zn-dependent oxidoreductase [Planctomycetota bacterium]|jgi:NADPH:quinone reductase-like Zn-dependent oxidoreductase
MTSDSKAPARMRAVHLVEHGGPEALRMVELPVPEPAEGEVRVKVAAISLNHLDVWVRRGLPGVEIPMPHVPGCDGTGVIDALGPGVGAGVAIGMPVLIEPGYTLVDGPEVLAGMDHLAPDYGIRGEHSSGLAAEYVCVQARYVTPLPAGLDLIQTAAVPLVFVTAWGMLHHRAKIQSGETVLVLGAASGVGSAAIQIAKAHGCRVIATAGSEGKRALGRDLGADAVLNHRDEGWPKEVKALTEGRGADVVFEHIGPATWDGAMRSLARCGRLVTCGGTTGPKVSITLPHLFMKNQSVLGSTMGPRSAFREILDGVASGLFRPVVHSVLPIEEIAEAHRMLEGREVVGKLVLTF